MLGEAIAKPTLGLTDVEQLTSRAADAIDEVGGGAGEPLPHLERLLGSLNGVKGDGKATSVAFLAVARESARRGGGAGGKGQIDQGVPEGAVSVESRKGRRWKDVASGRIPLEVATMSEEYMLYATADGVEGEDKGDSVLVMSGGMGSESGATGCRGDPGRRGEPPFPKE